jgi:hypothetical protein
VAGPYDVIARVQAPGMDELGRLVVARIQAVDGVTPHPDLHDDPPLTPGGTTARHRATRPALAVRARPRVVQAVHAGRRPEGPRVPGAIRRVSTYRPRSHCQGFREPETTCAEPMPSHRRRFDGRPDQVLLARQFVVSALVETHRSGRWRGCWSAR